MSSLFIFLEIIKSNLDSCQDCSLQNDCKTFVNVLQGKIRLDVDDYALMLAYYTNGKDKSFNFRKQQLENLIHKDAVIYQLYSNEIGVEIYTKEEFINFLTIPTSSLKNIHFISKGFKNDKIVKLKFMVR